MPPDTRTKLLDAAAKVFGEKGYAATSMDDIAAEAGMTKGALYWNFDGKEQLFHALLQERIYAPLRALIEFTRSGSPEDSASDQAGSVMQALGEQPGMLAISYEHWLSARREPERRGEQADLWRTMRDALADALHARAQTLGAPEFDVDPERVATAYIAMAHGLGMWKLIDPEIADPELYSQMCALIYEGLYARAAGFTPDQKP